MLVRKVTVIFIYLVSVVVLFVCADKESKKRMQGSTHAFQQMVRYGRSSIKDGKINVYPRADVFYLGPRYGKRSRTNSSPLNNPGPINNLNDKIFPCTYTGVINLYRCNTPRRSAFKQHRT